MTRIFFSSAVHTEGFLGGIRYWSTPLNTYLSDQTLCRSEKSSLSTGVSDVSFWTITNPEEGLLSCPYISEACWRSKLLERHVYESHGPAHAATMEM